MPGSPTSAWAALLGSTSCVQFRPPPLCAVKFSSGSSTRRLMPLTSFLSSVVLAAGRVEGIMPPPQLFVRLSESSFRLAFTEAGPSEARRARSPAFALPLGDPRILAARSTLR